MNYINNITIKEKNKHLVFKHYETVQSEYNHFVATNKNKVGITEFKRNLAVKIGTALSNLYEIINDGLITVRNSDLTERIEFSATVAWQKRTRKNIVSNSLKFEDAKTFIELVIAEFKSEYNMNSIDEIIHDLTENRQAEIEGMTPICTSTFYNYINSGLISEIKRSDLPEDCKRKKRDTDKEGKKGKSNPIGTSIEERDFKPDDRSNFGHWEGDTIVGSTKIKNSGAVLTLVERKTRFLITIKMKNRKALTVVKAIKKIKQKYPELKEYDISKIFKSITFDNGKEFTKWNDIEKYLKTSIYFAHPYSSYERGTNEMAINY